MEKMTLDELLHHINCFGEANESSTANIIHAFIKKNRDALTAGLQKPLRFKEKNGTWAEVFPDGEYVYDDGDGNSALNYYDKQAVINDCKRRGLPCEFIE